MNDATLFDPSPQPDPQPAPVTAIDSDELPGSTVPTASPIAAESAEPTRSQEDIAGEEPSKEPTWSVTELFNEINDALNRHFSGDIWVEGELRNFKRSKANHVYFDLVDPDHPKDLGRPSLAVTLFNRERERVNNFLRQQGGSIQMGDGIQVRIRGRLQTYAARSSVQLRMNWIDPHFTIGVLDRQRELLLRTLSAEGILRANAATVLNPTPLRIALITSVGSAAHADVLAEFSRHELGFQIHVLDARTQGVEAEDSLVSALLTADQLGVDVVALSRGGGARTDLLAFDSEAVTRTITAMKTPVFTGIGHEIDRTVADEVAHSAFKTPTACAAAISEMVAHSRDSVIDYGHRLLISSDTLLSRADAALVASATRIGSMAQATLNFADQQTSHLSHRIAVAAKSCVDQQSLRVTQHEQRLAINARNQVASQFDHLQQLSALLAAHDPKRSLQRGWAIARGPSGEVLRSVHDVAPGDELQITLADGQVIATITATQPRSPEDE